MITFSWLVKHKVKSREEKNTEKLFGKTIQTRRYSVSVSQKCILSCIFNIPAHTEELTTPQSASGLKGLGTTTLHIQQVCILIQLRMIRT